MENLADIVSLLEKPLRLELKKGLKDTAVTGTSLGAYAAEWALRAEHIAPTETARAAFLDLRRLMSDYDRASPQARRAKVEKALEILAGAASRAGGVIPRRDQPARLPAGQSARPAALRSRGRAGAPTRAAAVETDRPMGSEKPVSEAELDLPLESKGPKGGRRRWVARLEKLGVLTRRDLLHYFPRDHLPLKKIVEARHGERVCLLVETGQRSEQALRRGPKHKLMRYSLEVRDDTGSAHVSSIAQVPARRPSQWVAPWQLPYEAGQSILVEGIARRLGSAVQVEYRDSHPVPPSFARHGQLVPFYPLTDGVYQSHLRLSIRELLDRYSEVIPDIIPEKLLRGRGLMEASAALRQIHWPGSLELKERARRRLVFEEFLILQLALAQRKKEIQRPGTGPILPAPEDLASRIEAHLPFELTAAQRKVIAEIADDLRSGSPMNRLLQGDVGSGKTLVAMAALLIAFYNGAQGALMAPTEILAEQHSLVLSQLMKPFGVQVRLLIGSLPAREKKRAQRDAATGEAHIVVGTHALIQEAVQFHRLEAVIVDEQHRFGVLQRAALREKACPSASRLIGRACPEAGPGGLNPHVLVMTATPIPRTLALTVYGDLDVSVLGELPPGRQEVETRWVASHQVSRAYDLVREQVRAGRQAYVVCPLIEESEKLQAQAAVKLAEELRASVFTDFEVGLLHGRLTTAEREKVMDSFRRGEVQVLATTTVIEVGVDVPNACVMVVLNAERFGLAQLHQLRGRVGRGAEKSYCILVADSRYDPRLAGFGRLISTGQEGLDVGRSRLRTMLDHSDGFVIAEEDLRLRGPGEFYGTRQHGLPELRLADLAADLGILEEARETALELVSQDPALESEEHGLLGQRVSEVRRKLEAVAP
jgi:ATP-dependent DNA helicase RecG